ncbi:MAG TPA: ribonuclease H-like domain-containing protein [Candidatus Woesearchaeota archaeon]|nr:ribonuclease H-like domain-containing protein [Candidatus Woesearchaeota archaeon]
MIKNSFIHLENFGLKKERSIWAQGIIVWDDFISSKSLKGISLLKKRNFDESLRKSYNAYYSKDSLFFYKNFPVGEFWRFFEDFKNECVFLDIETNSHCQTTVVGLYDGENCNQFIRGYNLDSNNLYEALKDFKLIVSFNGSCFDVPILNKEFGDVVPNVPHFDLRFGLKKLGFIGGLKNIEKQLDIKREDLIQGVSGADAIFLWNNYLRSHNKEYLAKLLEYNKADIVNLLPLAEYCYKELKELYLL